MIMGGGGQNLVCFNDTVWIAIGDTSRCVSCTGHPCGVWKIMWRIFPSEAGHYGTDLSPFKATECEGFTEAVRGGHVCSPGTSPTRV
jgi:hypothetical protein